MNKINLTGMQFGDALRLSRCDAEEGEKFDN